MMDGMKFLLHVLTCLAGIEFGVGIIEGEKAAKNLLPYVVSVQNRQHICGGILISDNLVVTSAHCDDQPTTVVLGTQNLKEVKRRIYIDKKYKPRAYVSLQYGHDIMLLKLSRKAELDDQTQTIRLPCSEVNIQDNKNCFVAGWGKTSTHGKVVDELRIANVSVIKPQVCKNKWPGLPPNVICAGGFNTNKGFCQGDDGGPLVCDGILVGIVSFNRNSNCDYPDVPNVYTDLSKHLAWINRIISENRNSYSQSCMFCVRKL